MPGRGKTLELLDFPKFAAPTLLRLDAPLTSISLIERIGGKSFMSYGQIWPRMAAIVGGFATDDYITSQFNAYDDEWKNNSIRDAVRLLKEHFGGRGRWYSMGTQPLHVLGFWFKPSIKGIWYVDGQAYAVLINARKGQRLQPEHLRFLARGIYELHCVDDPNDPIPLVVDLSERQIGEGRRLSVHAIPPEQAITLDKFDSTVREFLRALELAGISTPTEADAESIISLLKKK